MSTTGEVMQRLRTAGEEPRNGDAAVTGREKGGNGECGDSPESTPSTGSGRNSWDSPLRSPESRRAQHAAPLQKDGDASPRKDGNAPLQEGGDAHASERDNAPVRKNGDVPPCEGGDEPVRESAAEPVQKGHDTPLPQPSAAPKTGAKYKGSEQLNDLYHAFKIIDLYGADIRYCKKLGGFLVWNGGRWVADESGYVWQCAIRAAWQEFSSGDAGPQKRKWALNSLRRKRIEDALKQLQERHEVIAKADEFDRDPWLLNVKNGTIDLRTGELREHRREDLITRIAPVEFNTTGERPRLWEEFLTEIFGGDCALRDFVQRVCGYALTGSVGEQKLFFLHGSGANGKTTFLETLMFVMGDYARRIAPSLLFAHSRDMHPTRLADLKGSRLAVTTEVEFGKRLAEAVVKELTGGDRLAARRMHQDSFEFEPTHKVFMCGNHLPVIRGSDHAIWRRIVLIPFGVTIPEEGQDKDLARKLRAEAAGILNWLVTGCLEWQKKGPGEPSDVITATRAYRSDMDALGIFLSDRCVLTPTAQTTSADLYTAYAEWCEKNGEYPMSMSLLGPALKEHGLKQKRTKTERMWQGLCLKKKRR